MSTVSMISQAPGMDSQGKTGLASTAVPGVQPSASPFASKGGFNQVMQSQLTGLDVKKPAQPDVSNLDQLLALLFQAGVIRTEPTSDPQVEPLTVTDAASAQQKVTVDVKQLLAAFPSISQQAGQLSGSVDSAQNKGFISSFIQKMTQGPVSLQDLKALLASIETAPGAAPLLQPSLKLPLVETTIQKNVALIFGNVGGTKSIGASKNVEVGSNQAAVSAVAMKVQTVTDLPVSPSAWVHQMKLDTADQSADTNAKTDEQNVSLTPPAGVFAGMEQLHAPVKTGTGEIQHFQVPVQDLSAHLKDIVVKQADIQNIAGTKTFTITLVPEGLGEIKVLVQGSDNPNQVSIQLLADTPQTKDLLDSSLAVLRTELTAQGLHAKIETGSLAGTQTFAMNSGLFNGKQGSGEQEMKQQHSRKRSSVGPIEAVNFQDEWELRAHQLQTGSLDTQINLTA